jgi:hypothetical protein
MRNHTLALRARIGNDERILPVWWDDDDRLHCTSPLGPVVVPAGDQHPVATLVEELRARGLSPRGVSTAASSIALAT